MQKMYKTCKNCALNTIHYRENIHNFFYIFGYLLFFTTIRIGILENNIYIFSIVNSVVVYSFDGLPQGSTAAYGGMELSVYRFYYNLV